MPRTTKMSRTMSRTIAALSALVLAAGCGGGATAPATPAAPPRAKQLTATDGVHEANPACAPSGDAIVFESDATGNRELWLLPGGGAPARQLTHHQAEDTAPCWLPDGSGIVFESTRSGTKSIWRLDLDAPGAEPVPITDDAGEDGSPDVSPDGKFVVYESNRGGPTGLDLWLSPVGGGTPVRLTVSVDGSYDRTADWSPDGRFIVFESDRKDGASALYVVPAKGGNLARLTPVAGYEGHPAWSPDGRRVAYESNSGGTMEIWCVGADGAGARELTSEGGYWPSWNAAGDRIVYCQWKSPAANVWEIAAP